MDFFGDYEIDSQTTTRPRTKSILDSTTQYKTSSTITTTEETTDKILIPLGEREKEILIFSLCGIIFLMAVCFTVYIVRARKRRTGIGFELEKLTAGSSTTLFDTKNR